MQSVCACGEVILRRPGARGRLPSRCQRCTAKLERDRERRRRARAAIGTSCQACGTEFPPRRYRGGQPKRFCNATCQHFAYEHPGERRQRDRRCQRCDAPIDHRAINAKWCSDVCGDLARAERLRAESVFPRPAACARCEQPFEQLRAAHRFCTRRCYQAAYLEAHPEKRGPRWARSNRRKRLPGDWETRRKRVLARDPVCRVCDGAPSTEVDHIERGDDHRFRNLQGICSDCHKAKTHREATAAQIQRRRKARGILTGLA